jgi:hypothetical protein
MTAFNYSAGVLNLAIQPRIADVQGNDLYPMLSRLQKRSIAQTAVKWNADVGGAAVSGETVTSAATTDSTEGAVVPATLAIGTSRFRHTFTVQTTKMAEAAANGEGALANLLAYAGRTGMRALLRQVATSIYTGNGLAASAGMVGLNQLHTAVTSGLSTDSYASINPATYSKWSNYVNTHGSNRALTQALLFKMSEEIIGGATLGVNSNYTAIYTTPAIATKYKELFQASSELTAVGGGVADVGYTGLSFEGRPIFMDPYCPANTLYFVDESEIALYSYVESLNAFGDEEPAEGVNFKMVELARTNPDAVQFAIVVKPQLVVERRAAVAVLNAITQ